MIKPIMIKPLGKRVLIEVIKEDTIILTNDTNVIKEVGRVVAIGKDVKTVKVGDTVMFKLWSLDSIEHAGEINTFIEEDAILAIYAPA